MNDPRVVEIVPLPPDLRCLQLMLSPKALGNALVTVRDIGLSPPISASAVVILFFPCAFCTICLLIESGRSFFFFYLFHLNQLLNLISTVDERFSYCYRTTEFYTYLYPIEIMCFM